MLLYEGRVRDLHGALSPSNARPGARSSAWWSPSSEVAVDSRACSRACSLKRAGRVSAGAVEDELRAASARGAHGAFQVLADFYEDRGQLSRAVLWRAHARLTGMGVERSFPP